MLQETPGTVQNHQKSRVASDLFSSGYHKPDPEQRKSQRDSEWGKIDAHGSVNQRTTIKKNRETVYGLKTDSLGFQL
jgi:hypothetical protein